MITNVIFNLILILERKTKKKARSEKSEGKKAIAKGKNSNFVTNFNTLPNHPNNKHRPILTTTLSNNNNLTPTSSEIHVYHVFSTFSFRLKRLTGSFASGNSTGVRHPVAAPKRPRLVTSRRINDWGRIRGLAYALAGVLCGLVLRNTTRSASRSGKS